MTIGNDVEARGFGKTQSNGRRRIGNLDVFLGWKREAHLDVAVAVVLNEVAGLPWFTGGICSGPVCRVIDGSAAPGGDPEIRLDRHERLVGKRKVRTHERRLAGRLRWQQL